MVVHLVRLQLLLTALPNNGNVMYYIGKYLDNLVKLDKGWRISNRTWIRAGPGYSSNYGVGTA